MAVNLEKEKAFSFITSFQIKASFYNYLKIIGIFSYNCTSSNQDNNVKNLRFKINLLKSGPFVSLRKMLLILWIFKSIFVTGQLVRCFFFEATSSKVILGFLCFIGSTYAALGIQIKFGKCAQQICDLLNYFGDIEQDIYCKKVLDLWIFLETNLAILPFLPKKTTVTFFLFQTTTPLKMKLL